MPGRASLISGGLHCNKINSFKCESPMSSVTDINKSNVQSSTLLFLGVPVFLVLAHEFKAKGARRFCQRKSRGETG